MKGAKGSQTSCILKFTMVFVYMQSMLYSGFVFQLLMWTLAFPGNPIFSFKTPFCFHNYYSLSYLLCKIIMLKPSLIPNVTELWVAETMVNGWNGGQIPTAFRAIPRDLLVLKDKEN